MTETSPKAYATFWDGVTGRDQRVSLELSQTTLVLVSDTGLRMDWPLHDLYLVDRPSYGALLISDTAQSVARLLVDNPSLADHLARVAPQLSGEVHPTEDTDGHVFADYSDGQSAEVHRVGLELSPTELQLIEADGTRQIWPLIDLRALPDQANATGIVVTPGHNTLERLYIDNPNIAAHLHRVAPDLREKAPITDWGRIASWAAGALASVALIIFVLVPIMADQLATYLPPEGEAALGDATFEQIRRALGELEGPVPVCDAPEGVAAMEAMLARLNPGDDLPYPVKISVFDHDLINAFALPGGRIIMFRGMIEEAENPDEIASVLAHELGHVVYRDPTRDALRSAGSIGVLGLLFGDFAGGTVVLMLSNQLINAKYSQAAEARADEYSHHLMEEAGLNPAALGTMFERLVAAHGDTEGLMAHFASHPQSVKRIEAAQEAAEGKEFERESLNAQEWRALRSICGPVYEGEEETQGPRKLGGAN